MPFPVGHGTSDFPTTAHIHQVPTPALIARHASRAVLERGKPIFMVHRYEYAQQMLRDNETFSSSIIIQAFGDVFGKHVMLGMDEPEHGRHRALVSKAFSQKALARFQDELVARVANDLIDKMAPNGKANLVKEFTFPYPTRVIAGLLGLPEED